MVSPAPAVIVTLSNEPTNFSSIIVLSDQSTHVPVGSVVGVGFFQTIADLDLAATAPNLLATDFLFFGSPQEMGVSGFGGLYEALVNDGGRVGPASPFLNRNLYTVIGNSGTLASSNQFLIYKHTQTFPNDLNDPIDASVNALFNSAGGTFLMGGPTGGKVDLIQGFPIDAYALAGAIPEPSTALAGLLGLGLLAVRRRRA